MDGVKLKLTKQTDMIGDVGCGAVAVAAMLIIAVIIPIGTALNEREAYQFASLPRVESFENLQDLLIGASGNNFDDWFLFENTVRQAGLSEASSLDTSIERRREHSTTNIQVEGVDEADIVKTDGNYIYYISNNRVVVVDVRNPENLKIASEIVYTRRCYNKFYAT